MEGARGSPRCCCCWLRTPRGLIARGLIAPTMLVATIALSAYVAPTCPVTPASKISMSSMGSEVPAQWRAVSRGGTAAPSTLKKVDVSPAADEVMSWFDAGTRLTPAGAGTPSRWRSVSRGGEEAPATFKKTNEVMSQKDKEKRAFDSVLDMVGTTAKVRHLVSTPYTRVSPSLFCSSHPESPHRSLVSKPRWWASRLRRWQLRPRAS